MRFTGVREVSVAPPYRLDLTVDVLRRIAANVVDDWHDGVFRRLFDDATGRYAVRVRQIAPDRISVETSGEHTVALQRVALMLGFERSVASWSERARRIAWLEPLADRLRGLRPPRYPSLWEACAHAVVFQQISIYAAGAIMQRLVEALTQPQRVDRRTLYPFFTATALLDASENVLREAGLSRGKVAHLQNIARAIVAGEIDASQIEALSTDAAAQRLIGLRGIGPWSAAVVLLRGFGRLDTFPMNDSGVAASIKRIVGELPVDVDEVLETLGDMRGFLYYHLLLARRIDTLLPALDDHAPGGALPHDRR